jgi:hypothetical protein
MHLHPGSRLMKGKTILMYLADGDNVFKRLLRRERHPPRPLVTLVPGSRLSYASGRLD